MTGGGCVAACLMSLLIGGHSCGAFRPMRRQLQLDLLRQMLCNVSLQMIVSCLGADEAAGGGGGSFHKCDRPLGEYTPR